MTSDTITSRLPLAAWLLASLALAAVSGPMRAQEVETKADAEALVKQCMQVSRVDPDKATALAQKILRRKDLVPPQRRNTEICLGVAASITGQPEAAVQAVTHALAAPDGRNEPLASRVHAQGGIAFILINIGQGGRAATLMKNAYGEAARAHDDAARLIALDMLSIIRGSSFDDPAGSISYLEEAIDLASALGKSQPFRSYNLGLGLVELGRNDEAWKAFNAALQGTRNKKNLHVLELRILSNRTEILMARDQFDHARNELHTTIKAQQAAGDNQGVADSYTRLAKAQLGSHLVELAVASAKQAVTLARSGHFQRELHRASSRWYAL